MCQYYYEDNFDLKGNGLGNSGKSVDHPLRTAMQQAIRESKNLVAPWGEDKRTSENFKKEEMGYSGKYDDSK